MSRRDVGEEGYEWPVESPASVRKELLGLERRTEWHSRAQRPGVAPQRRPTTVRSKKEDKLVDPCAEGADRKET
jgi:hypothetical protein